MILAMRSASCEPVALWALFHPASEDAALGVSLVGSTDPRKDDCPGVLYTPPHISLRTKDWSTYITYADSQHCVQVMTSMFTLEHGDHSISTSGTGVRGSESHVHFYDPF